MTRMSWKFAFKLAMTIVVVSWLSSLVQVDSAAQLNQSLYPQPRFPAVGRKAVTSVADVMPYARQAAQNKAAAFGGGLGLSTAGETIVIVVSPNNNEPHIIEAIRRALVERKITPQVLTRTDQGMVPWVYEAALKPKPGRDGGGPRVTGMTVTEAGFTEGSVPGQVPFPRLTRNWLRTTRPDLFKLLYPKMSIEAEPAPPNEKPSLGFSGDSNDVLITYLQKHPEVDGVYSAGTWYQEAGSLGPFRTKWRGTALFEKWTVISNVPSYPADVWAMTEQKNIEPLAFVDRFRLTDPEGTDLSADISPDLAQRWSRGAYERGHNMLGPNMATGRFARSIVSYPAMSGDWIPRSPIATPTGVVAATTNHVGYFPLMKMYYKDGYLTSVEGGGYYGELARTHLKSYPKINTAQYPYYDGKPGFFYLHEIALGTNPKWFRPPTPDMSATTVQERLKAGYLHIGLGASMESDPSAPKRSDTWQRFAEKDNLPFYHGLHMHLYFATYTVRLRNSGKTVDIIKNGHMTSLNDPEVRALASRYGDPNGILAEDWIAEVPGINAPGRYEDYARAPYKYHKAVNDKILAGAYEHFYPPVSRSGQQ